MYGLIKRRVHVYMNVTQPLYIFRPLPILPLRPTRPMANDPTLCSAENMELLLNSDTIAELNGLARGPLPVSTALWGNFSCLIAFSIFLWIRDGIHSRRRMIMMALCVLMYLVSTAHWGVSVGWWNKTSLLQEKKLSASIRAALFANDSTCFLFVASNPAEDLLSMPPPTCALTALLTVNIVLSDAIVLFRACMIWTCNRVVRTVSAMLFFLLLGFSGYNMYLTCASRLVCSLCSSAGTTVVAISLALNIWATAVVGRKTWIYMRAIKPLARVESVRMKPEKILMLIVESGFLYCTLWMIVLIGELVGLRGERIIIYLQNSSLIQLVGMYPTVLVTAAAFERLQGDAVVANVDTSPPSSYLSKHLVSAAHDATDPTMPQH